MVPNQCEGGAFTKNPNYRVGEIVHWSGTLALHVALIAAVYFHCPCPPPHNQANLKHKCHTLKISKAMFCFIQRSLKYIKDPDIINFAVDIYMVPGK